MATIRKRQWQTKGETRTAWVVDFADRSGKRDRKQFDTRGEADAFRIKVESQVSSGTYRASANLTTVKDVADLFIEHCRVRMERHERMTRHNFDVYVGHVGNYIAPDIERRTRNQRWLRNTQFDKGLADVTLRDLTTGRVDRFCDDLKDAGLKVPTIRKILSTLKQVLRYAVSRDLVAHNVARDVSVIGRRDQGSKKIIPPSKQAMRQLIAVADENFRVRLLFAAATGARAGEFHALRWRHVDLISGEVKIQTRVDAHGSEDVTKTVAGMREIPLGQDIIAVLKSWKLRSKFVQPDDLIFPNRRGGYEGHDNMIKRRYRRLFDKLREQHEADPEQNPRPPAYFNWHALRHYAISCWIEAGLPPKTVQTFAGHSSLQVTMDRYGHLFKSDDHRQAMDRIAKQMLDK